MTLDKMAKGGIYDHLAGGFHRYSVDEHWVVPHFEKMAYDNSELLKNYVHAYQQFGEEEFARVARDILRWMDEWLSDREQGGFYASQDADFSLDDDGDYFTWTRDEAAEVLTAGGAGDRRRILRHWRDRRHAAQRREERAARQARAGAGGAQGRASPWTRRARCWMSAKRKLYAARLAAAHSLRGQDDVRCLERDVHLGLPAGGARAGSPEARRRLR